MFYSHEPPSDLERAKATILELSSALQAARRAADVEHAAAELARESAARAWRVASSPVRPPPPDTGARRR